MKHLTAKILMLIAAVAMCCGADAQLSRLADTLVCRSELTGSLVKGDFAPHWMANNHYGLSATEGN